MLWSRVAAAVVKQAKVVGGAWEEKKKGEREKDVEGEERELLGWDAL